MGWMKMWLAAAFAAVGGCALPVSSGGSGQAAFRAILRGESHGPRMGAPWRYSVRAVDMAGRPVRATATIRVLVHGRRVDTIGVFTFKGTLRRTYRWSPGLDGSTATIQARVLGPGGTRLAGYWVRVRGTSSSTGRPRFRASLTADSHAPRTSERWGYVVRARDPRGRPVGGTVVVRVVAAGKIVDTVGLFGFDGTLRRRYRWSTNLIGSAAVFQAKVIGPGGTRTIGYGVRVR
jgi:hypothetical protein